MICVQSCAIVTPHHDRAADHELEHRHLYRGLGFLVHGASDINGRAAGPGLRQRAVLTAVRALNLGDCKVLGIQLETDLLNPIIAGCSGASASSTPGSSTSTTITTAPTVGSTMAPAATHITKSSASCSGRRPPWTPQRPSRRQRPRLRRPRSQ